MATPEQALGTERVELFNDLEIQRVAWMGAKAIGGGKVELETLDGLLDELSDLNRAIIRGPIHDYD
jgi:hypothetical protein